MYLPLDCFAFIGYRPFVVSSERSHQRVAGRPRDPPPQGGPPSGSPPSPPPPTMLPFDRLYLVRSQLYPGGCHNGFLSATTILSVISPLQRLSFYFSDRGFSPTEFFRHPSLQNPLPSNTPYSWRGLLSGLPSRKYTSRCSFHFFWCWHP